MGAVSLTPPIIGPPYPRRFWQPRVSY